MSSNRLIRVNELLKREVASCLPRLLPADEVDLSSLTVTDVSTSPDLRNARVKVSILGHEDERDQMLALIKRYRKEIQKTVFKVVKLKYTPRLNFVLDISLEAGDRVLKLINELDNEEQDHEPG